MISNCPCAQGLHDQCRDPKGCPCQHKTPEQVAGRYVFPKPKKQEALSEG